MRSFAFYIVCLILLANSYVVSQNTVSNIHGINIHGEEFDLYEQLSNGKSVLLDFWWVECSNCVTWAPWLERIHRETNYNKEELFVMGLNVVKGETNDNKGIREFKKQLDITYPDAGWENNTVQGENKFYQYWFSSIRPITQSSGFVQCALIIPNLEDVSKSEVVWSGHGDLGKDGFLNYLAITDAMFLNGSRTIWKSTLTGLDDVTSKDDFSLYPNPAIDVLNVHFDGPIIQAEISIYSASGRLIHKEILANTSDMQLSTDHYAPGLYLMSVNSDEQIHKRMFVVNSR
ncbi:MAG: T9SS type A sorting domain-containing protein [Vicingaceae bacterium]